LGADCVPRYVEMKQMGSFDVETIFKQTETASNVWMCLYVEAWIKHLLTCFILGLDTIVNGVFSVLG